MLEKNLKKLEKDQGVLSSIVWTMHYASQFRKNDGGLANESEGKGTYGETPKS